MSDGIKFPIAVSGAALLGVVFGGGGLWVKVDSQAETIRELKSAAISGERIARCEQAIADLQAEDAEIKEILKALWRVRGNREDSR